jgi:uncharacterized protein (DUF427 family)
VGDYPQAIVPVDHVEPVPRRVRAILGGQYVLDTTHALYVWEWANYPQFYIPLVDVNCEMLIDEQHSQRVHRGNTKLYTLAVGDLVHKSAVRVYVDSVIDGLAGTARIEWNAMDSWFEEDEEIFVHPRNPYSRVDALRSTRHVRVELDGVVLAESSSPVMVFETGLPTRYYLNPTEVNFAHLKRTETLTACPYKGETSKYWSVQIGETRYPDLAWSYDFPTRQLSPIAGLIAFYNEKVDITLDGERLTRPETHFS